MFSLVFCVAAPGATFPASWAPVRAAGLPVTDPVGDEASGPLDLVGDASAAALEWWADRDQLYLRLQVAGDPSAADGAWTFLIDEDGAGATFERAVTVSDPVGSLGLLVNDGGVAGTWVADPVVSGLAGDVGFVQDGEGWWVEVAASRAELGVGPTVPIRIAAVTATAWPLGQVDAAGCSGTPCADLGVILSDPFTIDLDQDGLADPEEAALGTSATDMDSDDDGVLDGDEAFDHDGDGTLDALECDTDGDGLSDGTELGRTVATAGTKSTGCFVPDADPSTTTDPAAADTDGGGLSDGREDPNHDGKLEVWETDPNRAGDDLDSDGDGIPDLFDDLYGAGPDVDSDGDGIPDADESLGDPDTDGLPTFADPDADGDGHPDALEGIVDTDGDGIPDFLDLDSDGDGLGDADEPEVDLDGDGAMDWLDPDSDNDGLGDGDEGLGDTDGDGTPDRHQVDSDDDTLPDGLDGAEDTDGDGLLDFQDPDSDGDGWPDAVESYVDTDKDGVPDFQDTDSDGDGILDVNEPDADSDCDGLVDRLDADREDGWCDSVAVPEVSDARPANAPVSSGCDTTPRGAPWWATALLAMLWRRRQRVRVLLAATALVPLAAATVQAEQGTLDRLPSAPQPRGDLRMVTDARSAWDNVGTALPEWAVADEFTLDAVMAESDRAFGRRARAATGRPVPSPIGEAAAPSAGWVPVEWGTVPALADVAPEPAWERERQPITVHLVDRAGRPVAGVVRVGRAELGRGWAIAGQAPEGTVTVAAEAEGYAAQSRSVRIRRGVPAEVWMVLVLG